MSSDNRPITNSNFDPDPKLYCSVLDFASFDLGWQYSIQNKNEMIRASCEYLLAKYEAENPDRREIKIQWVDMDGNPIE